MTANNYSEVSWDTIHHLKQQGFTTVQLVLLDLKNPYQSTVELIPGQRHDFQMDIIPLHSNEIQHYLDRQSPMAKYVINQEYL